eukprot:scaffold33523_cov112-Isochrysis_galbana.AAC.6
MFVAPCSMRKSPVSSLRLVGAPTSRCAPTCRSTSAAGLDWAEQTATMTACRASGPSPCMAQEDWNPASLNRARHCSYDIKGDTWFWRAGSITDAHQASVSPSVIWAKAQVCKTSFTISAPPECRSCRQWSIVLRMNGVACSTLLAIATS